MRFHSVISALLALLLACGTGGNGSSNGSDPSVVPHGQVTVHSTIGIELGDTSYVFGQIRQAVPMADGGVAVLDGNAMNARVFSVDGDIRAIIGRQGNGPGEFAMPFGMALLSSGDLIVSDMGSGIVQVFDDSLDWKGEISGFFPRPPRSVVSAGDGFTGLMRTFDREEGLMGYSIVRIESDPHPAIVYMEDMYPFDASMMGPMGEEKMPVFTSDDSGRVFVAVPHDDLIEVTGFTLEGEVFMEIAEDIERVAKTEEELALEEEEFQEFAERRGSGRGRMSGMEMNFDPEPYRLAVRELGVDSYSRLWVRLGTYDYPFWNVYDMTGELLMTASLEIDDPDLDYMNVRIEDEGAAAWVEDPTTWPRVRILDLPI